MMGVTTKLSLLLFVASKCRGTVLSKPTSMSYACCSDLVPTSPPDWPPYCLGSLSDCRTYRHPFDLQFSLSIICMVSPVLFILMDLMTSWGFLVKNAQAPHCLREEPLLHLLTPLFVSLKLDLVFSTLLLGNSRSRSRSRSHCYL